MSSVSGNAPEWDVEQLEVILATPDSWQLVVAGPGTGKSAVACQRVAYLIDEGIPPSRILLVSFTRTAVAELRERIVTYAGERARSVRLSTIDAHAWTLRAGCDDDPLKNIGDGSYDLSIARTIDLFRKSQVDLCDFMSQLEHLLVDEAQDVVGVRAELTIEMLRRLSPACGVTILADPAQAIYGFTTDEEDAEQPAASLLERLATDSPRPLIPRSLEQVHRIENEQLIDVFFQTRKAIEVADSAAGHVARIQQIIRETCGNDAGVTSYSSIPDFLTRNGNASMLVLFRRRADVLFASSYCSQADVQHRLRMSDLPVVVRPWIGWLFGEVRQAIIGKDDFERLWAARHAVAPAAFEGEQRDQAWELLHRFAAGRRPGTIDLVQLRRWIARTRPPIEFCYPDLGCFGPILGTIHASKGREADTVVLVMSSLREQDDDGRDAARVFEEGRVYYVGATRARRMLIGARHTASYVCYLDSNRIYRPLESRRVQLEVGRDGDVDPLAHLAWSNSVDVQRVLAMYAGRTIAIHGRAFPEYDYSTRLILEQRSDDGVIRYVDIGQLNESFRRDLWKVCERIGPEGNLRPPQVIPHLYLIGVTTVGLTETQQAAVRDPFNQSGLALAPVVKGFPAIRFQYRRSMNKGW